MMTAEAWKKAIAAGQFDADFTILYGQGERTVKKQRERYTSAIDVFSETYGPKRQLSVYSTPGRTEIGGNHTDHNHGLVMAGAVTLDIIAVVSPNADMVARVKSHGFSKSDEVDLTLLSPVEDEKNTSAALIRGVAAGLKERGGNVGGFDAYTTSDVLSGSGLSSSAAFEVCMASVLNGEYNDGRFTAVELGQISQYAENVFFGKPSGLMDQTACAVGGVITIDFKDPKNPVVHSIPFDLQPFGYHLVITDTKGSHANLTPEYAAIREEMEEVARYFGENVLRDVDEAQFYANIPDLRKACGDRAVLRSIHFYNECKRVPMLAQAIESGDFDTFLSLILEGGDSSYEYNQNAYSVSAVKEQGIPLGLALSQKVLSGKGAWRLQGGGFAGTIQAFVPDSRLESYIQTLSSVFGDDACYVLGLRPHGCVRLEENGK